MDTETSIDAVRGKLDEIMPVLFSAVLAALGAAQVEGEQA